MKNTLEITKEMKAEFTKEFGEIKAEMTMGELMMRYPRYRRFTEAFSANNGMEKPYEAKQQMILSEMLINALERFEQAATNEEAAQVMEEIMNEFMEITLKHSMKMYGLEMSDEELEMHREVVKISTQPHIDELKEICLRIEL